jgi:hypothetical protein
MANPPVRQLPPPIPEEEDALTDLQTPDDEPPAAPAETEDTPDNEEKKETI